MPTAHTHPSPLAFGQPLAEHEVMLRQLIDLIFPPRESELLLRNLPDNGLASFLEPRVIEFERLSITTLLQYDQAYVRAAILEAKFHGNRHAAGLLAAVLATYLTEELSDRRTYETQRTVLISIPLSRKRFAERGYNQVERITQLAAKSLTGLTVITDLLTRVRDTSPQTSLDGVGRRRNMCSAFRLSRHPETNTLYIVVDDVVTTGATLSEATAVLKLAGAEVMAVAIAH